MRCQSCAFENRPGTRFCEQCGTALESACPACGDSGPGDRRFCGQCGQPLSGAPPGSANDADPGPWSTTERRNLTVMFCDLVDSTVLVQRLDPEDMSRLIKAYADTVSGICRRYGAYVARFLGDGVLSYFGYPRSYEDNAERSIRAAIEVIEAVRGIEVNPGSHLDCRIGIASGEAVTGETLEADAGEDTIAIGNTMNLAARLQSLADRGRIVVSENVHALTRDKFEFADLGRHSLKGYADAQQAWQVLGIADADTESQTLPGQGTLVGRDDELDVLARCWREAHQGRGQAVHLVGQPGIGKTRLIQGLEQHIARDPHHQIAAACSAIERESALHPFAALLAHRAGFTAGDGDSERHDRLRAMLESDIGADDAVLQALCWVTGLDANGNEPLEPRERKRRMLAGLQAWLERLSLRSPLLLVIQDLQWADPTTLEWLSRMIRNVTSVPMFLVVASRPEFDPPWGSSENVRSIPLRNLSPHGAQSIVDNLTDGKSLPREVMDLVIERTDGVPLFVEAFTRTILETGVVRDIGERFVLDGPRRFAPRRSRSRGP